MSKRVINSVPPLLSPPSTGKTSSPPSSATDAASTPSHSAAAAGRRNLSQITDQVVGVLRATSLEARPAAIEAEVRNFPDADHLAAARVVVAWWQAGETRAPSARPIFRCALGQQCAAARTAKPDPQRRYHLQGGPNELDELFAALDDMDSEQVFNAYRTLRLARKADPGASAITPHGVRQEVHELYKREAIGASEQEAPHG